MKGLVHVGDILAGKYRVERILGIGGMGMVVQATHLELDQQVAIKFMLPSALESPAAADRFMREARAAGRLTNEHVCRVSDVGRFDSGVPYIVMEYLEGLDLGTLLKRKGPLPVDAAVDYIIQAAEGMAEAHGHGIVHRDLKPDNLFLHTRSDDSQIIKVLDFGISKAQVTGVATKTGDIMGSPAFMAPEQMQSTKDVDPRADVWSLGVILYQLISGRMPFIADTLPALCMAVIHDAPPSLDSIRKDLPHGLAQVAMKCLAKHRDDRYLNVLDLARALAPYGKPQSASAITRIRSLLQRHRPPTPPPLMMLPSEFSDVAPTLVGDDDGSLPVARVVTPLPARLVETTLGGSSGESVEMTVLGRRVNRGVVGALVGAIALVGLIILMVVLRREDSPAAAAAAPAAAPAARDVHVTPIDAAVEVAAPVVVAQPEPAGTVVVEQTAPEVVAEPSHRRRHGHHEEKKVVELKAKPEAGVGSGSAGAGSASPATVGDGAGSGAGAGAGAGAGSGSSSTTEEDLWGHMHHDGDRLE